jgi:hypothetical protein
VLCGHDIPLLVVFVQIFPIFVTRRGFLMLLWSPCNRCTHSNMLRLAIMVERQAVARTLVAHCPYWFLLLLTINQHLLQPWKGSLLAVCATRPSRWYS